MGSLLRMMSEEKVVVLLLVEQPAAVYSAVIAKSFEQRQEGLPVDW